MFGHRVGRLAVYTRNVDTKPAAGPQQEDTKSLDQVSPQYLHHAIPSFNLGLHCHKT